MLEREVADDSIPLAAESDDEMLGDIERSIGSDLEACPEVADADGASLRACITGERNNENRKDKRPPPQKLTFGSSRSPAAASKNSSSR